MGYLFRSITGTSPPAVRGYVFSLGQLIGVFLSLGKHLHNRLLSKLVKLLLLVLGLNS
jgi:hypothetical protein